MSDAMTDEKLHFMYVMQAVDPSKAASRDNWKPEDAETFNLHWANLERLRDSGVLILAGRTQDADGTGPAICIIEVDSEDEARRIFESEPFFARGFATASCTPFAWRSQGKKYEPRTRCAIANWRLAKADRFLAAARDASKRGHWETVASRAYYATYHLVAAVLEEKVGVSWQPWRAEQLLRDFRQHFTHRGFLFFSSREADTLRWLLDERHDADYRNKPFNEKRAVAALEAAEKLCSRLEMVARNA